MSRDVLLHLVEPAQWRAALADGALRPPSLTSVGFVHLSTPEQVHVPAQALFPGRRDLVLLVVDPARLTDPVRMEPGMPPHPAGLLFLFPHLYGPLPTAAVIAVVPYRPPAPFRLPAPDDRLTRALTHVTSLPLRRAVGVGDVPGGVAVLDPDFPYSRDNNRLLLSSPVDADSVATSAAEVAGNAGWPHRAASLLWPDAGPVAAELGRRGWDVEELLLMARPAAATPGGDRAQVVAQSEVHDLWDRSWRRDLAGTRDLDRVVAQLVGREQLNDRVVAVSDVVAREDGRVVAAGQLRVDGATAAVDSVLTEPAARGRGHADAVLARALGMAAEAGCDLVVLEAAADDWPRHWYARRGFEALTSVWSVSREA
jgi:uncharacterized protein (DUF952 family)/ribosomal protein S18 acetylase RimI-like enzyme